jgi:antitoxin YefM
MHTVSLDEARSGFDAVVARVLADSEPTIVRAPNGESVAVIPLSDFEAWQETAYLMRTPANAAHLRRSIEESEAGNTSVRDLGE